jgi:hypothetical protein
MKSGTICCDDCCIGSLYELPGLGFSFSISSMATLKLIFGDVQPLYDLVVMLAGELLEMTF